MKPPLDGRILVTGASSGIGREIARQLAPWARDLILVARREERLRELRDELVARHPSLKVDVRPCDLADPAAIDRLVEGIGDVDVLVNNAGSADVGLYEFAPWPKVEGILKVNVLAVAQLTHRLLGPMLRRGRGGILNISSGFGMLWMPGMATYIGSKHFVTSFTESLRSELVGTGVVVTQLCAGPVETEFLEVAGNPTGHDVPGILRIGAERCARAAVRGFAKGRAMVIPGFWIGLLLWIGRMAPRFLHRWTYWWIGGYLRRRQSRDSIKRRPGNVQ